MACELAGTQKHFGHPLPGVLALTVGVPAVVGKDAVFAFGAFSKVVALADLFATVCMCCSVDSGDVRLDWGTQLCCDWQSVMKGQLRLLLVPPDGLLPMIM